MLDCRPQLPCIVLQTFFVEDMGLDLRMTPNYDDFSCQFSCVRSAQCMPNFAKHHELLIGLCCKLSSLFVTKWLTAKHPDGRA